MEMLTSRLPFYINQAKHKANDLYVTSKKKNALQ